MNYTIEARGVWRPSHTLVDWRPSEYGLIANGDPGEWEAFVRDHPGTFNGTLARYVGCESIPTTNDETTSGALVIRLGATDYRSHIVTNVLHPDYEEPRLANGCAVSMLVVTTDNRVPIGLRSSILAEGAGVWHVPGGNIGVPKDRAQPNVFEVAETELREELGLNTEELTDWRCLGVVRSARTLKPDIIVACRATIAADELADRSADAQDAFEHDGWEYVPTTDLAAWISGRRLAAAGSAAIDLLHRPTR